MQVHSCNTKDVAVLQSKEWFQLDEHRHRAPRPDLDFQSPEFGPLQEQDCVPQCRDYRSGLLELPTKEIIQVASVEYEAGASHGNPVIDYLQRHGSAIDQPVNFENPIPLSGKTPLVLKAPASNETYARVSGDYNPIHVSRVFSSYANLPGTITHGMYSSAAVRSLVETWAAENNIGRVRSFHVSLVGMVLPMTIIEVKLQHVGMVAGRKIIKVEASNKETEEKVLLGEAEVEQPVSRLMSSPDKALRSKVWVWTCTCSPVAKEVWDRADSHFYRRTTVSTITGFALPTLSRTTPRSSPSTLVALVARPSARTTWP